MLNFNYNIPTKIFFGENQIKVLGKEIKPYANKVLLVYGGGSIKKNGIYDEVVKIFNENQIEYFELPNVKPNPRIDSVRKGVNIVKANNIEFILAVGGGSSLDCAKIIAAGACYNNDPWDLVLDRTKIVKALPIGSIITLSATGSEMNPSAVISNEETNEKFGTSSPYIIPKFSILDPKYTFTVPRNQTAAGSADILCHVFEVYFSTTNSAYLQNRLAEAVMKTVIHYSKTAMDNPTNYEARANLMWASSLAINGLLSYGKITEWTIHKMEHELSAFYDITHGTGLGILMPRWMEFSLNDQTLDKFYEYAVNVFNIKPSKDKKAVALEGIEKTKEFLYSTLEIPKSLKEIGIGNENFEKMAKKAVIKGKDGVIGNFSKLSSKDVLKIYEMSLN